VTLARGITADARISKIVVTTRSSINVKPFGCLGGDEGNGFTRRNEETKTNEEHFVIVSVSSILRVITVSFRIPYLNALSPSLD
jgi:hypothetical protein